MLVEAGPYLHHPDSPRHQKWLGLCHFTSKTIGLKVQLFVTGVGFHKKSQGVCRSGGGCFTGRF